jgi:hypothetical protein
MEVTYDAKTATATLTLPDGQQVTLTRADLVEMMRGIDLASIKPHPKITQPTS